MQRVGLGAVALLLIVVAPAGGAVVVESVETGRVAQQAGLQPGDVLSSWRWTTGSPSSRPKDLARFDSSFDVWKLELEQRRVTFNVAKRSGAITVELRPGRWGLETRPVLDESSGSHYRQAVALIEQGEIESGAEKLQRLSLTARNAGNIELACWLLQDGGEWLAQASRWAASEQLYSQAANLALPSDRVGLDAYLRYTQGKVLQEKGRYEESAAAFEFASRKWEQVSPDGLAAAETFEARGELALERGQLDAAETYLSESLSTRQRHTGTALVVAESLRDLGRLAIDRGDLREAERLLSRAVAFQEESAGDSLELVDTINSLALVGMRDGSYEVATARTERAFSIVEKLAPTSLSMATSLSNRAKLAWLAEDLSKAEELHRRALAIDETRDPNSARTASHLINLGVALAHRQELEAAEKLYRRALAIKERISPESRDVAILLGNLGIIAIDRENYEDAELFTRRSLAIKEKTVPGSISLAVGLQNLALIASHRSQIGRAEELHRRAIDIIELHAPGSLRVSESLYELGNLAVRRGAFDIARGFHLQALEIHSRFKPGSFIEAESLFALGELALEVRNNEEAVDWLQRSVEALEVQTERLGGRQEVRAEFAATYLNYYQQLIRVLVELDRPAEAFHYVERSRARALLSLLAERELDLDSAISGNLAVERKRIEINYDRMQAQLAKLNAGSAPSKVEQLRIQQQELRDRLALLKKQVRQQSPRFGALEYPEPFDLARTRNSLDRGTVLLSYLVAEEETLLFVVRPAIEGGTGLSVHRIHTGREAIEQRVSILRSLIERARQSNGVERALAAQGRGLFDTLLGPAQQAIAAADRLLISPDGPLHTLPFSALIRNTASDGAEASREYLVEWKPIHKVISATVYGELSRSRQANRAGQTIQIAAFADPRVPADLNLDPARLRGTTSRGTGSGERGYELGPLPESREEARAIAELYGDEALVFVGDEVTEEQVEAIGKKARMFHFACHSLLDEDSPLNSSLVLSVDEEWKPGRENGLLQAWEIFESLEIDADLVTLSACQTALGKEIGGEGLVGLARAFQFAGARSVLASLWSVSDRSTTELMRRFYTELKAGETKDEALRSAQLALIRGPDSTRSPFHWAAFELIGDWR